MRFPYFREVIALRLDDRWILRQSGHLASLWIDIMLTDSRFASLRDAVPDFDEIIFGIGILS